MEGVLPVVRLLLAFLHRPRSSSNPQAGLRATESQMGFTGFGVGVSEAAAEEAAASGLKGRMVQVPGEALCQGHTTEQKQSPALSLSRARSQRRPPRSEEVGLSPPEVIQYSLGELGHFSQCVRETLPGVFWGWGVGGG